MDKKTLWVKKVPLNKYFWAYLAGFIDGEGCIHVPIIKKNNRIGNLHVSITNTYPYVLSYIHSVFPGVLRNKYKNSNKPNSAFSYKLYWTGKGARILLRRVLPFLIIKIKQAKLGLKFPIEFDRSKRKCISIKGKLIRRNLAQQLCILNKRGPGRYEFVEFNKR